LSNDMSYFLVQKKKKNVLWFIIVKRKEYCVQQLQCQ